MTAPNATSYGISLVTARVLSAVASVRPDERRHTFGAFLTLFGFMTGHALLETARDVLFLASWPASKLPWAYLLIAVCALTIVRSQDRLLRRFKTRHELTAWLGLCAVITAGFWIVAPLVGAWVFYALYVWSGVLATLVVVRFWTVLGSTFTVTQAKRLFAVIGTGSVLGAIAGSGAARVLTGVTPARHLILAAALAFAAASLAPRLLTGVRDEKRIDDSTTPTSDDPVAVARHIWTQPYLKRVALLILLATVTFTLVDYVFKSTVDRTVPAAQMGEFFSSVYLALNLVSLVVQVFAVPWLVRRVGINAVQGAFPLSLLLCSVGYVASAGLAAALVLKAVDGSLRHSLYRTGTELLFVPLSVDVRGRVKAVIDVVGQRGGQALASLAILAVLVVTSREWVFAAVAAIVALAWLRLAIDLRTHYVNVFRESLRDEVARTRIDLPELDVASLEVLVETLNDSDDRKVVAAMELLAVQGKTAVIPALILYHPSKQVVLNALNLFIESRRDDCLRILERLLLDSNADIAAAALNMHSLLRPTETVLRLATESDAPQVYATAAVALVANGWMEKQDCLDRIGSALEKGDSDTKTAVALAIRQHPEPYFDEILIQLARSSEVAVRVVAVRAMRRVATTSCVPVLIELMADRVLRDEVRVALVAIGPVALPELLDALGNTDLPHGVRRHLPLAVAAFGTPKAANNLLRRLLAETDGMIRFKVLQALGRLRVDHPGLPLDEAALTRAFQQTLGVAFDYMRWRHALDEGGRVRPARRTDVHGTLVALLRDKEKHSVERLFRLLNLISNDEDFARIHHGLQSVRRETRAGSRELVEHIVLQRFRVPLLTLIDDLYEQSASPVHERVDRYETVLTELAASPVESVSAFASAQITKLQKGAL